MVRRIIAQNERIVIGTDVHDVRHNAAVVDREGQILHETAMPAHRKSWENLLKRLPDCQVTVVYEAGPHGYNLHDLIKELGHSCKVVAPQKHVGVKTDKRDARAIAKDFLASRAGIVAVPEYAKRVRRQVVRTRESLKKEARRLKTQINSMKRFHGLEGGLAAVKKDTTGYIEYMEKVQQEIIAFIQAKIKELESILKAIAMEEEYEKQVKALMSLTGVGFTTAMSVTLGIADIGKFKKSKQFSSYLGLCPVENSSGEKRRLGHISKRGPGRLRGLLVQCAWSRVRHDEDERERYKKLSARIGSRRAIVAVARRLAVSMWWALKNSGGADPVQLSV